MNDCPKKLFWRDLEDTPSDEASQSDGESSAKQYEMSVHQARTADQKIDPRRTYRNQECLMNTRNPEPSHVMPVHLGSTATDSDSAGRTRNRYPSLNSKSKEHLNNNSKEKCQDDINDNFQQRPVMIRNHWDDGESWNQDKNDSSRGKTDTSGWYYEGGNAEDQQTTFSQWMRSSDGKIHLRNYKLKEQWDEHTWKPTSSANNERERFYGTFTYEQDDNVNAEGNEQHFCQAKQKDNALIWRERGINEPCNFNVVDASHFSEESEEDFSVEFDEDGRKNNLSSGNMVNKTNSRENFQHRRCNNSKNRTRRDIDISSTKERKHHETALYGNALFGNFQTNSIPVIGCSADMDKYREHLIKNGRIEDGASNSEDFFLKINAKVEEKKKLQQQQKPHNVGYQKVEYCEKNYQSDNSDYNIWDHKNGIIFDNRHSDICQSNYESCSNNNVNCNDNSKDDSPSSDLSDRFGDPSEESDDEEYEAFSSGVRVHRSQSVLPNSPNCLGRTDGGQRSTKNQRKPKKKTREISKNLGKKTCEPIQDYILQQDHHINYEKQRHHKFPKSSRNTWEDASEIKEVREHIGNHPQESIQSYQQTNNCDNLEYPTRFVVRNSNDKARQYMPNIRKNEEKSRSTVPLNANRINGWTGIGVKYPEAEYQKSEAYYHSRKEEDPYNDNSKFANDPLVDLRDNVSYPNGRFVYEDTEGKSVERRAQYNESMKAGRSQSSVPRTLRKIVGRQQGSTHGSHKNNFAETSELRGEQLLVVQNKDINRSPREGKTDVTDLFQKQEKFIDFGYQISHSLTSSHLAKQLFLSMYHEWLTIRERTITLLQKILENIRESEGWHDTFIRNWNAGTETPTKNEYGISQSLKTFWRIISNSSNPPTRSTVTFNISAQDVHRILEEDVSLSGEIQMYGLQCVTQFKETNKLMKNFRYTVLKDQLFENLRYENFQNFLMAIVKTDPDDISFCEEVSKAYKILIDSVDEVYIPDTAYDAFCKFLKEDATILKTMGSVNWNPCNGFDGSYGGLMNDGSEAITRFAKDLGSWSKTYTIQNVVETLKVLIAEKTIFARDAAFLL